MDVRCGRCGTEYDFDDALVSERGTTVKCTNCGHQFKVFPGGAASVPERWIVRKGSGRELVYTSLRDLQRAIAQRQVGPQDLLSRGGGHPPRALAAIAELEPFFHAQRPAMGPQEQAQRTLLGMSPTATSPRAEDTARDNPSFAGPPPSPAVRRPNMTPAGGIAPERRAPGAGSTQRVPAGQLQEPARFEDIEPKTLPRHHLPDTPTELEMSPVATMSSGQVAGNVPTNALSDDSVNDGLNAAFRTYQDSFSDESLPSFGGPRRNATLRWVVGLVLVGAIAFVAGTVGVRYVKQLRAAPAPTATPEDARVKKLLTQGDADLSRGDFESAKEQFDKASILAEKAPAVLSAVARLEATRADEHWLALKILPLSNQADRATEAAELSRRIPRVRKAVEDASAVAPNDPSVLGVRIDALRLAGSLSAARDLVGSLGDVSSQPEAAYVLGALDLSEALPAWSSVVDRLRTAISGDRGTFRARAALIYALSNSGAADDAKQELAKLDSGSPSKLSGWLQAYIDRATGTAATGALSGTANTTPTQSATATIPAAPVVPAGPAGAATPPALPLAGDTVPRGTDFRKLLEDASTAKRSGDLGRAEALYRAAEEQSPGNIEAMGGLGDVAKGRGDTASAARYYESVLQQNPTYLPTLISLADIKWSSGDRPAALTLYKRVANQAAPGSTYAQRAAQKLAEAPSGAPHEAPPKPTTDTPSKPPSPSGDTPGNVDTTDLPGFK